MNLLVQCALFVCLTTSCTFSQTASELELAVKAFQAGNLLEATKQFETLYVDLQDDKLRHVAGFYLAEIKWRSGDFDEAIRLFDQANDWVSQATEQDPQLDSLRVALDQAQLRIARHDLSADRIVQSQTRAERISSQSQSSQTRCLAKLLLGAIYTDHKHDPAAALPYFDEVANSPYATLAEKTIAVYGRATALVALKKIDEAIAFIDSALSDPNNATMESNLLLLYGAVCLESNRIEECDTTLQRLSKATPSQELADQILLLHAKYAVATGNREQALLDWNEIVKNHSDQPSATTARIELAKGQIAQGDDASAMILLDAALGRALSSEQRATALCERGSIWLMRRKLVDAKKDLESALNHVSNEHQERRVRFQLSETLYRMEAWQEANQHWEWLTSHPESGDTANNWLMAVQIHQAELLAHQYRWDEAADLAGKIQEEHPASRYQSEIDYLLGRCAMSKADMEQSRQYFSKVIESQHSKLTELAARAQWMIGESYLLQKNIDSALQAYTAVLSQYDFAEWKAAAITQSGKCYELRGQLTEAANLYGQVATQFADTSYAGIARSRMSELKLAKRSERKTQK